jgi:nitroimidazol reductase NimA-like FMN-containing flavoprotein (pyridoxamine 5'-phosphate oxidase superfamily)
MSFPLDPETVLLKPLMAHLATVGAHGPCHSPVWFLWEDEAVWLVSSRSESLVERLRREPRCAIGIVDFDSESGILRHVGMRGTARLHDVDLGRRNRLVSRYIGAEADWPHGFRQEVIDTIDVMVEITPDSVVARDQSYFSKNSPLQYGTTP